MPHARQVPPVPAHVVDADARDAKPGAQLHARSCAPPPAHALPTSHGWHVPPVPSHANDVLALEV